MKKFLQATAVLTALTLGLTACGGGNTPASQPSAAPATEAAAAPDGTKIVVGATAVPHAELLEQVVEDLKAKNIDLEVKVFANYELLNPALNDKQVDANFFQHLPYLEQYCKDSGQKLVSIGGIHVEPMGVYSKKVKSLDELVDGSIVGVPNDATNEGRALLLLAANNLIKLKDGVGLTAVPADITENPKNLKFQEIEAASLPRTLEDTDISVINTNYALEGGLNPVKDALVMEDKNSPYANIVAVREGDESRPELQELYKALASEKIKKFIEEKYDGGIVPAF